VAAIFDAGTVVASPASRILGRTAERGSLFHMDPLYARGNNRAAEPCPENEIAADMCPRCRTRLLVPDHHCAECGAPMFGVNVAGAGQVEWCARQGCPGCRWEAMDALGPQPYVELAVEDTGRGISPEERDRLFDPFFTTKGSRGTGLGLAVSWGIVEGHAGTITVESEPGRGTTFDVVLPAGHE